MTTEKKDTIVDTLTELGGSEWQKGGHHRVYFDTGDWAPHADLKLRYHKTGSIFRARFEGERISNNCARKLTDGKIFYDVRKRQWTAQYFTDEEAAHEAIETLKAEIAGIEVDDTPDHGIDLDLTEGVSIVRIEDQLQHTTWYHVSDIEALIPRAQQAIEEQAADVDLTKLSGDELVDAIFAWAEDLIVGQRTPAQTFVMSVQTLLDSPQQLEQAKTAVCGAVLARIEAAA